MARPTIVQKAVAAVRPEPMGPVAAVKILYHENDDKKNRALAKAAAASIDKAVAAEIKRRNALGQA